MKKGALLCGLLFLGLVAVEIICQILSSSPFTTKTPNFESLGNRPLPAIVQKDLALWKKQPGQKPNSYEIDFQNVYSGPESLFDGNPGLAADRKVNATYRNFRDHSVLLELEYNTDHLHSRVSGKHMTDANQAFAFMGDEDTFGEGLRDQDTLPSQMAKLNPGNNAYNFAVSGAEIGAFLHCLQQDENCPLLLPKEKQIRYFFVWNERQLPRTAGDFFWLNENSSHWLRFQYQLKNGNLVPAGEYGRFPVGILEHSALLRELGYHKTNPVQAIALTTAIAKEVKDTLAKKKPGAQFYFVLRPTAMDITGQLRTSLEKAGVRVFDYSTINFFEALGDHALSAIRTPSAEWQELLAGLISEDLKK